MGTFVWDCHKIKSIPLIRYKFGLDDNLSRCSEDLKLLPRGSNSSCQRPNKVFILKSVINPTKCLVVSYSCYCYCCSCSYIWEWAPSSNGSFLEPREWKWFQIGNSGQLCRQIWRIAVYSWWTAVDRIDEGRTRKSEEGVSECTLTKKNALLKTPTVLNQ